MLPTNVTEAELLAIPQKTPDYIFHKQMMFESILWVNAQRALETGTDLGDSARIFATALRKTGGSLITMDIKAPEDAGWLKEYPNVQVAIGDTTAVPWTTEIDFLFLDDHVKGMDTHKHIVMELEKFGRWVRKGGLILIHDTMHLDFGAGLVKGIREFCAKYGLRWMEDPQQHGMAVIEVIRDLRSVPSQP